jgi:polyisoprenoid-binding protein YceI
MNRLISLLITLSLFGPLTALAQTYSLDPARTTIQFKVRNMLIMNVTGVFEKFKGTVHIDKTDMSKSTADVSIETASINTGIDRRDDDLRSSGFFDTAQYPTMTFVSTKVEPGAGTLKVTGNLTIKGVTKEVVLTVEGPKSLQDDVNLAATATATINRQDFGVSKGAVIADEVFITIKTELVKQ